MDGCVMSEDLKTFEARVRRIDPDFNPTRWHRWRTRERRKLVIPMRGTAYVLVFAYVALTGVKVALEQELGRAGYDAQVERLASGGDTSRIAAKLLFRDPVLDYVTRQL